MSNIRIGVVGMWHLGCVISASWSLLGYEVISFDFDKDVIDNLNNKKSPIYEPALDEILFRGGVKFTNNISDLKNCDFVFLSYDTPVNSDDSSNVEILIKSITNLGKILKDNSIVIVSSQTPIGFSSKLRNILKEFNSTLDLAYSPENLRLGYALSCYLHPGRIILGTNDIITEEKVTNLFKIITGLILNMSIESAEMVKHGINSFLATSIVFANQLANLCSIKNANIKDVIKGMRSDNRIGDSAYLTPGIGFSGGTLGRDLKILKNINDSQDYRSAKLFGKIYEFNNDRKFDILHKIKEQINNKPIKIGVLGLTYKPNTSTLRRSLPIEIVNLMSKEFNTIIKVYDPKANYNELETYNFEIKSSIEKLINDVDYIVIFTEWDDFKNFNWNSIDKELTIFDTKNYLEYQKFNKNIKYYCL